MTVRILTSDATKAHSPITHHPYESAEAQPREGKAWHAEFRGQGRLDVIGLCSCMVPRCPETRIHGACSRAFSLRSKAIRIVDESAGRACHPAAGSCRSVTLVADRQGHPARFSSGAARGSGTPSLVLGTGHLLGAETCFTGGDDVRLGSDADIRSARRAGAPTFPVTGWAGLRSAVAFRGLRPAEWC
jgi:hypothetical protein